MPERKSLYRKHYLFWAIKLSTFFVFLSLFTPVYAQVFRMEHQLGEAYDQRILYTALQGFLKNYSRPFTMLDIGVHFDDCWAFRIAQDYEAVCVIIGMDSRLLESCKKQNISNIILLKKMFSPDELCHLGECEHFDVMFAGDVRGIFEQQWPEAIDAMLTLGDHLFVVVTEDDVEITEYLTVRGGCTFAEYGSYLLYHVAPLNNHLQRKTWLRPRFKHQLYSVESTFECKQLVKPVTLPKGTFRKVSWVPGINLCTFKMCGGAYPTKELLKNSLHELKDSTHSDWLINNMIIQGQRLKLIDGDERLSKCYFSEELLQAHLEILDIDEPRKVEHYFWRKLIKTPVLRHQKIKFFGKLFPSFSLVFEIDSVDEKLVEQYLGYGSKVVCCNARGYSSELCEKSKKENLFLTTDVCLKQRIGSSKLLDGLISLYGVPKFCVLHSDVDVVYDRLRTLSQALACIAFRFDLQNKTELRRCLDYLITLGFSEFNFSVREIPSLILEDNRYRDYFHDWATSAEELLGEVENFAQLDHDGHALWGYIYARTSDRACS